MDSMHCESMRRLGQCEPVSLRSELEAANAEIEQLRVQLAGCSVAALGDMTNVANQGDYGWSPAYEDVLSLRLCFEAADAENERLKEKLDALQNKVALLKPHIDPMVSDNEDLIVAAIINLDWANNTFLVQQAKIVHLVDKQEQLEDQHN